MTVVLVLLTFVAFLLIDHFYSKRRGVAPVIVTQPAVARELRAPRLHPSIVAGFKVPENLRYHPGHTWALSESPNLVRCGIDDFAGKLTGKVESVNLPQRGQWVRQGQKIWSFVRNGVKIDMVSPIEGSITDINEAVIKDPSLATADPYGDGWMVTVQAPDSKTNFRNLLGGALARSWMEDTAIRFQKFVPAMGAATMADGGIAVDDLGATLAPEKMAEAAHEFFLA